MFLKKFKKIFNNNNISLLLYNMDRNIKYKTICRVGIYGDDNINTLSNSRYNIYPSSITGITVVNGGSHYSQSAT